jgi:ABC-type transport system involved in cytochrome bd biosynthesis fused ATPase/permease subunit
VLELAAAIATALVAVEVGLRLLYGHMAYETALLVLLRGRRGDPGRGHRPGRP